MAYSVVPTKAVGNTWTAAENNQYLRDNFEAGVPAIFTAKGDIAVASAADAAGALAVGSNGYVLIADSAQTLGVKWGIDPALDIVTTKGDLLVASAADTMDRLALGTNNQVLTVDTAQTLGVKWAAAPSISTAIVAARYTKNNTQVITTAAAAEIVEFNVSDYDTNSAVTTGASWKFTVPASQGGKYLVTCMIYCQSSANWGVNEAVYISVFKNGTEIGRIAQMNMQDAGTYVITLTGAIIVNLAASDYIDVRCYQNSGGDITIDSTGTTSHIAIAKLG